MTLPTQPVPAPGFEKNPGAFPDMLPRDTKLTVQFACGYIDDKHTYTPAQLKWKLTGDPFNVGAIKPA